MCLIYRKLQRLELSFWIKVRRDCPPIFFLGGGGGCLGIENDRKKFWFHLLVFFFLIQFSLALSFWQVLIPPALASNPSALSHVIIIDSDSGEQIIAPDPTPQFTQHHLDIWIEFQKSKGKAISRDTWDMFLDFVRVTDKDFKDYDEEGEEK